MLSELVQTVGSEETIPPAAVDASPDRARKTRQGGPSDSMRRASGRRSDRSGKARYLAEREGFEPSMDETALPVFETGEIEPNRPYVRGVRVPGERKGERKVIRLPPATVILEPGTRLASLARSRCPREARACTARA